MAPRHLRPLPSDRGQKHKAAVLPQWHLCRLEDFDCHHCARRPTYGDARNRMGFRQFFYGASAYRQAHVLEQSLDSNVQRVFESSLVVTVQPSVLEDREIIPPVNIKMSLKDDFVLR